MRRELLVGLDVGSTTVKAVAVARESGELVWKDYQRHETRQREKAFEFLTRIHEDTGASASQVAVFCTGSGGGPVAEAIGAPFVQEVNAVALAVRRIHPRARSVVELGGQDAKIVIFQEDPKTGRISTLPSMNDKCASGTGATIEKVARKVGTPFDKLGACRYLPYADRLVHIAAKCGVFAETDVVGHLKAGLPEEQILASLFDSIVSQNLAVLTRGYTLRPEVILLGGPNTYIQGLIEAWRHHIAKLWKERGVASAEGASVEDLVVVPPNSQYFAAIGCIESARGEGDRFIDDADYRGAEALAETLARGSAAGGDGGGLWETRAELEDFLRTYARKPFQPATFEAGQRVEAFLGVDGGSTSTKAVLLDEGGGVLAKSYILSDGNPIQDTMDCVARLRAYVEGFGARLVVRGCGATGYAKDILARIIGVDAAVVETVAHTMAARWVYPRADVVVDVGGQDIKIIMLQDGRVSDFRLNTQCSAGNGYFLQSTAEAFNVSIEKYAELAFQAERMPVFGYGCAVFMQSDIVNFQKEGWSANEILAGLAAVLPKNVWLYVSKIPNLVALGMNFVLQGGTQYNLAAVKAQVDFIRQRFRGTGTEPNVIVHEHCGEAGAIGAALEAMRVVSVRRRTSFVGLDAVSRIHYQKASDERTRCHFCKNRCSRTFIDVRAGAAGTPPGYESQVPLEPGWQRIITGFSCDRGTVESVDAMRAIKARMDEGMRSNPNTVDEIARRAFRPPPVAAAVPRYGFLGWRRRRELESRRKRREGVRIGIPRVLNMYSHAPFFLGYFRALGVLETNLVFSQTTSETMYRDGSKRGSIDPCFPSKLCIAHVHDLLSRVHSRTPLDFIFFPMVDSFPTPLVGVSASRACPTVVATPEAVKSAFTKETDIFAEHGLRFVNPFLNLDDRYLLRDQLFESMAEILELDRVENDIAVKAGLESLAVFQRDVRRRGREIIDTLVGEQRLGFVVLARPYHADAGVNHEILLKLQRMGYPILSQDSLPTDREFLDPLFVSDLESGVIADPREIGDVWPTSYSENTSQKIWAAKVVARHPNLVGLELSSFKCGHDAPIYTVVERIVSRSRTPFFTFRDLDENDPGGAIKLRLETIDYFLEREREKLRRGESSSDAILDLSELVSLSSRLETLQLQHQPVCSTASNAARGRRSGSGEGLVQIDVSARGQHGRTEAPVGASL